MHLGVVSLYDIISMLRTKFQVFDSLEFSKRSSQCWVLEFPTERCEGILNSGSGYTTPTGGTVAPSVQCVAMENERLLELCAS